MGQSSSSTAFQNSTQPLFSSRRSHNRSHHPSAAPPEVTPAVTPTPKSPTYIVAENKVLPNGVNDMSSARKLLRPVSLELSKFHPEFADIFQKSPDEGLDGDSSSTNERLNDSVDNKENSSVSLNTPRRLTENKTIINGKVGHLRKQSISSEDISDLYKNRPTPFDPINDRNNEDFDTTTPNGNVKMASNLLRSHSMGLSASQPVSLPKHKRQISMASNPIQEHIIPEDPREHLYNPARDVPFSNFEPSMTSLPVKSSFDIDYSMQLTYAQLAEYRRTKRTSELEERTGKMLGELEAAISASSNVPKSPFDLQNRPVRSSTHSVSTRSSDTGISKSKKKKAPAPPAPPLATKTGYVTAEPPPDYDTKDSPAVNYLQQAKILQRRVSSASKSSKPPAPQPFLKSASTISLSKPGSTASPTVQTARDLPESSATLPRTAPVKGQTPEVSTVGLAAKSNVQVQESITQAKAQLEALKKLQDILNRPASPGPKTTKDEMSDASVSGSNDVLINVVETETTLNNDKISKTDNGYKVSQSEDIKREEIEVDVHQTKVDQSEPQQIQPHHSGNDSSSAATVVSHSMSTISPGDKEATKRIDPLLQKDIILAALARQTMSKIQEPTSKHPKGLPSKSLNEKATANTAEITQHNDSSSNTGLSEDHTSQIHEEKAILHSDVLAETNNLASPDFGKGLSSISIMSTEFWSPGAAASPHDKFSDKLPQLDTSLDQEDRSKISDKLPQLDTSLDQEDRSSSMSVDFSKRSSIQSENMSIGSSNASGRVFSPDWAPEHDLDSEDDIMDSSYSKLERRVSSEGFKVSVVPPKVRDLHDHETTKNKSHKRNKKRNEMKEANISPSNDKSKFGSLRKFKNNVHQGMKNAFGSISKASGTILNKQKSQDLHDDTKPSSNRRSAEFSNDVSASFRNPNWTLSRSVDESLHRRTLSDGLFNQRSVNILEHSDVSDHSEDDLGDIDFAGGISDLPKRNSNSRRRKSVDGREMASRRTGDEQANVKRQIVTVEYHGAAHGEYHGENHDLKVNGNALKVPEEFQEYSSKTYKEKKQDMKESASRKQENNKLEAVLAKMIEEKELQYEYEILRRQEIENSFRRLRDLEDKELLQRVQKEVTHEEIRKLQQQRLLMQAGNEMNNNDHKMSSLSKLNSETTGFPLNNSPSNNLNSSTTGISSSNRSIMFTPLNNLGATSSTVGNNTAYVNANQLSLPLQYLASGSVSLLPTGYLNSPISFQNIQQSYNMPSLSSTAIGHSVSPVAITNVNYVPPLFSGGGFTDGFTSNTIPKLTQQELIYLGEYMRMIGVPPPTNHHEWAVLLNSVGYKTSTLPLIGQNPGPMSFPVATNNPNLSSLLRNKNSPNDHTSKLTWQMADVTPSQQLVQSNKTPPQILHSNKATTIPQQLQDYIDNSSLTSEHSQDTSLNNQTDTNVVTVIEMHSHPRPSMSSPPTEAHVTVNTAKSVTSVHQYSVLGEHQGNTSTETTAKSDSQMANNENFPQATSIIVSSGTHSRTNLLPAKVYAPLGFRPVAFNPNPR